eukprot:TRINITY_DN4098_c0_g3_i8.p1 TRINITY_DN4098_c0_g3~~TRINITY_DN4098_c0_g3_i8.p1  ORF type:complete len:174 (-),score=37.64 TRINITY_DN4098_c0_g3_i8:147-623(-)
MCIRDRAVEIEIKGKSLISGDLAQQKEPIKLPGRIESSFQSSFSLIQRIIEANNYLFRYSGCFPVVAESIADTVAEKQIPLSPVLYKLILFPDIVISEVAEILRGKLRVDFYKLPITQDTNVVMVMNNYVVPNEANLSEIYNKCKSEDNWLYLNFLLF